MRVCAKVFFPIGKELLKQYGNLCRQIRRDSKLVHVNGLPLAKPLALTLQELVARAFSCVMLDLKLAQMQKPPGEQQVELLT